jgi:DNA-binding NarL/FixJ family response regulator
MVALHEAVADAQAPFGAQAQRVATPSAIRVLLFSDDEIFRAGCAQHLIGAADARLECSTSLRAWREVLAGADLGPQDVVVLDAPAPTGQVAQAAEQMRSRWPRTGLVLVSGALDQRHLGLVRELTGRPGGGIAVVERRSLRTPADLLSALQGAQGGRVVLDPALLGVRTGSSGEDIAARVSKREREVLDLMACGLTNAGIAARLCLEVKTVERHINSIYTKLPEHAGEGHPRVNVVVAYLLSRTQAA